MNTQTSSGGLGPPVLMAKFYTGLSEKVHSPFNKWVTGVSFDHQPTEDEIRIHFIVHGRAKYREEFASNHPGVF